MGLLGGEHLGGLAGVLLQTLGGFRHVLALGDILSWCGRCVGLLEPALAVSEVARAVLVPEGVVHGQGGGVTPEDGVRLPRVCADGRHPREVGRYVLVTLEAFPVGRLLRPEYGGIVFRLQPGAVEVTLNGRGGLAPLLELQELSCRASS